MCISGKLEQEPELGPDPELWCGTWVFTTKPAPAPTCFSVEFTRRQRPLRSQCLEEAALRISMKAMRDPASGRLLTEVQAENGRARQRAVNAPANDR